MTEPGQDRSHTERSKARVHRIDRLIEIGRVPIETEGRTPAGMKAVPSVRDADPPGCLSVVVARVVEGDAGSDSDMRDRVVNRLRARVRRENGDCRREADDVNQP